MNNEATLTQIHFTLQTWIGNCKYDQRQDWCDEESKRQLDQTVALLRQSKAALEELMLETKKHPQWNNITI
jgi:hypothetical protein